MPSLKDIRRRIKSVENIEQITNAMKMVAAAKLRKAQERVRAATPYADKISLVMRELSRRLEPGSHPLLEARPENRILLVVITSDPGLCGSFNANITRRAMQFLDEHRDRDLMVQEIGRKARDFFKRRPYVSRTSIVDLFDTLTLRQAIEIGEDLSAAYTEREFDAVYVLYNAFVSVSKQEVTLTRLFPIRPEEAGGPEAVVDYIYEPSKAGLVEVLLPQYVNFQIWRILLNSYAAEMAARMVAMGAASQNAEDMIARLVLKRNRIRQAVITRELIEIVSAAEAL